MKLFEPTRLGPVGLRNRLVKAATFEGMTPRGEPSTALIEHHRRLAAGGVAMTTVAYGAVARSGRTFADQILLGRDVVPALRRLTDAVHAHGAAASIQLVHCGGFRRIADGGGARGPSTAINTYGLATGVPLVRAMRSNEIDEVPRQFAAAARIARESGFDAVEVHLGHGYLLSQFLSPLTNRRRDAFGGDLHRRMRLPVEVVQRVREAVSELAVLVKTNLTDGVSGGLQLEDAVEIARSLAGTGVDAIEPSGGFTSKDAFFLLRGRAPLPEMIAAERNPLQRLALRTVGRWLVRDHPFTPMFFLEQARAIRAAVDVPVILLGGLVSRTDLERALAEGFELMALGRALIADPDFPARLERGELERTRCTACNACVAAMEVGGIRCVLDDDPAGQGRRP